MIYFFYDRNNSSLRLNTNHLARFLISTSLPIFPQASKLYFFRYCWWKELGLITIIYLSFKWKSWNNWVLRSSRPLLMLIEKLPSSFTPKYLPWFNRELTCTFIFTQAQTCSQCCLQKTQHQEQESSLLLFRSSWIPLFLCWALSLLTNFYQGVFAENIHSAHESRIGPHGSH